MRKIFLSLLFFCLLFGDLYSQSNESRRPPYRTGKARRGPTAEGKKPARRDAEKPAKPARREPPAKKDPTVNWDDLLERNGIRIPEAGSKNNPFRANKKYEVQNELDSIFLKSLQRENRDPSPLCSDEVFLRRIYLDLTGTIPTPKEVRSFLKDNSKDKRKKRIDLLLDRDEFVDLQTMRWCDLLRVKSEFPINLWPNGAVCYYRWIHQSVEENKPYSQFVRELLTACGSNFRDGPSNFYRAVPAKDSDTLAEAVCQTFLGMDIAPWPAEKRKQTALFFSRVGYKETAQWKEEIVYRNREPLDRTKVVFPDGSVKAIAASQDPRELFADWMISPANTLFSVCAVNRLWCWLFGKNLISEQKDAQNEKGQIHLELCQFLCRELIQSQYDLKHMYRLILNSGIYQQSSLSENKSTDTRELFASYPVRRIDAEVFQDMLAQIFDLPVGYTSEVAEPFTMISPQYRAVLLYDSSITSSFLEMFGRSSRDTGTETDRNNDVTESQQLFLLNSTEINEWIVQYANRLGNNWKSESIKDLIDEMELTFLSRFPTAEEYKTISDELRRTDKSGSQKIQDIIWCLLNSREFICKH
ncbi:MAG: DUF1553 domain-containing protein [Planctomycetia bacterium]|nr:DUF1553 domain-containing protein [Planctomycetia bacterium]